MDFSQEYIPFRNMATPPADSGQKMFLVWFLMKHGISVQNYLLGKRIWSEMSENGKQGWANFAVYAHNKVKQRLNYPENPQVQGREK